MLAWRTWPRIFVEPSVPIVRVRPNEAVFPPTDDRAFMDAEAPCHFLLGEHAAITKALVAGAQCILVDEVGHPERGERGVVPT